MKKRNDEKISKIAKCDEKKMLKNFKNRANVMKKKI